MSTLLVFTYKTIIDAPIEKVWSFFSDAHNLTEITGFPKVKILSNSKTIEGNVIIMELRFGLLQTNWVSVIEGVKEFERFTDRAIILPFPFREWKHEHTFKRDGNRTVMEDKVYFSSVLPSVVTRSILTQMFKGREKSIQSLLD
ncbi:SRPBCC family protein [Halalkalibacter krulwichiae]|uniref:Polyketide cyclase / dehydrase and lipid transport n=1 Tax=Halalkalibacter krulwichiae TaxID=199441 RepID=A0A1X9M7L5_9BACI|nr:hypothetical protein [Halalkalibacter krulwichiae]ARK29435.1 hypothetical protein BkAM31D_05970 [Halalkalibacter krulwichiae]